MADRDAPSIVHLVPHERDLGGFAVRRLLPQVARRALGPFTFFDEMGPAQFAPGEGMDVRPHPHIGLATVTYLFEGEIVHRDSLGTELTITPGAVNWMTAGRGIVHSERTGPELRARGHTLHGLQLWVALPVEHEEIVPAFSHYAATELPTVAVPGADIRVLIGAAYGASSPVHTLSPTVYLDVKLAAGATLDVPADYAERGLYLLLGELDIEGLPLARGTLAVLPEGRVVRVRAASEARWVLVGGAPLEGKRHIEWNFVSSSRERIERAKEDWTAQRFPKVPGEDEFIPLPT
jgi:hypothetical protein